jgi:peptidoglycan DL-endopeptidase CwlO
MKYHFSHDTLIDYASRFIGTPYQWGGNSADEGFDCSGYVYEVLTAFGIDRPSVRPTAQLLYEFYARKHPVSAPAKGSLAFYGKSLNEITHVAIHRDEHYILEAGGEGSESTRRGMVRQRPADNRKDYLVSIPII